MAESSLPATVEGIPPWPGILTHARRGMRGALDRRSWLGPLLLMVAVRSATWELQSKTGAPTPEQPPWTTGHPLGDVALGWGIAALSTILIPFGLGRLIGGRATLAETCIVLLWSQIPWLLLSLPLDGTGLVLYGPAWWSMENWLGRPSALLALPAGAIALKPIETIGEGWGLALWFIGLSEAHRLSVWRILLLIVLPLFALGVIAAVWAAVLVARTTAAGG